jgi:hypothetical protein
LAAGHGRTAGDYRQQHQRAATRARNEPYDPRSYFEKDKPNDDNIIDASVTVVGEK